MANVETNIQQRIRLALGTREDVRLFRNQVGQLPDPRTGRPVQFGLAKGSADIVGWKTVEVTPDMVAIGRSSRRNVSMASSCSKRSPDVATMTGSSTTGCDCRRSRSAMAAMVSIRETMPIFTALTVRSENTASICALTWSPIMIKVAV